MCSTGCCCCCLPCRLFEFFGAMVAIGALLFALIDPTVAAHWPVVMTDLPVGLLSTCVLVCIEALRNWNWVNLVLLSIVLGLTLSVKHSGLIAFGSTGLLTVIRPPAIITVISSCAGEPVASITAT